MNPLAVIEANIAEFQALGARRIGVFGSFVRGEARHDSDVDVYVEFDDAKRCYDNFFALHERLEKLLGRRVDLVTDKSISESKARLILPTVRYATLDYLSCSATFYGRPGLRVVLMFGMVVEARHVRG